VSKKPPQALSGDPAHPRSIKYSGIYVVWWDDGNWEWIKCVNCGAELTTPKSRERGCGPTCAEVVTEAAKEAISRDGMTEEEARGEDPQTETRARSIGEHADDRARRRPRPHWLAAAAISSPAATAGTPYALILPARKCVSWMGMRVRTAHPETPPSNA
jgi:hypothetical protein